MDKDKLGLSDFDYPILGYGQFKIDGGIELQSDTGYQEMATWKSAVPNDTNRFNP